jgi:predicted small secreted protein
MTKYFMLTLLAVSTLGLMACENTFHGAGRDIEKAGENVQEAVPAK